MPRGGRSQFRRTSAPARRGVAWALGPFGVSSLIATDLSQVFSTAVISVFEDQTIIRIRGELMFVMQSAASSFDGWTRVGFGMCIVSENAAGIGVTAVPAPIADIAWDGWMVHWTGAVIAGATTITNSEGSANFKVPIDSKAMRKLHATDVLIAVLETTGEVGVPVMRAYLNSRTLFKLS